MAKCKKCGKQEFLKGGLCYRCYKEEQRLERPKNILCNKCKTREVFKRGLCINCWEESTRNKIKQEEYNNYLLQCAKILGRKIAILCIFRDPSVIESFKLILKIKGIDVVTALNIEEGMEIVNKDIDIIFAEAYFGQNKLNGIDLPRLIREKGLNVPIAIITAYCFEGFAPEVNKLGIYEYLRMPFLMEEIYELVERGLKIRYGMEREKTSK
ncbi:MAG: response regulator [Actinobacteria bacterium]|nr:response regulator [Actinomycetota bacterium]